MSVLLSALRGLVGDRHVLTGNDEVAAFVTDWRGRYSGKALCVVRPGSPDEVARIIRFCADAGVAIVPQGGNTGLCGGATPIQGEVVLSLTRLSRIRAIDPDNNSITVESGCTLHEVQQAALAVDRIFPLSLAAEGTATIGGNLSTNAGGVQVLRYGNARELTLGLEVALPDGRLWEGLRCLRKDNTGYDLKQLFIGAEGTLGIITAASLKLFSRPRVCATAWASVANPEAAIGLLHLLRNRLDENITAFELIGHSALDLVLRHFPSARDHLTGSSPWHVLIEVSGAFDGLGEALEHGLAEALEVSMVEEGVVASSETQANALWALRENISEAQRIEGFSIKHDIAVPVSRIPEFIRRTDAALTEQFPELRIVCFGHVGDGNLHYNLSKSNAQENLEFIDQTASVNRVVHDIVNMLDGSISAEHGLGQLKREENQRYKSQVELDMMRWVKNSIDPNCLMNPGKLL